MRDDYLEQGKLQTSEGGTPALLKGGQPGTRGAETSSQRAQRDHAGAQHLMRCTAGTAAGTGLVSTGADAAVNSFPPNGTPKLEITLRPATIAQTQEQTLYPDAPHTWLPSNLHHSGIL